MSSPKLCSLKEKSFDDAAAELPPLTRIDFDAIQPIDLLILAKGFEERVLAVPTRLRAAGKLRKDTKILVGQYATNASDNECRYLQLEPILNNGCCIEVFDADSPADTNHVITRVLEELQGTPFVRVLFDMSGASSTLIFSVFYSMFCCDTRVQLEVSYAEAGMYYPDAGAAAEDRLELRRSPSWADSSPREEGAGAADYHELFKGHEFESRPNHVIGVPSLGTDRFERCLFHLGDEASPVPKDVLTLILPATSASDHAWREGVVEQLAQRLFATNQEGDGCVQLPNIVRCDTHQYRQIIGEILRISDEHPGHNLYLLHFGNKLQSVGAALALLVRSEITLMFTRPKRFHAERYSDGVGNIWQLHFSDPAKLLKGLREVGCLSVTWDEQSPDSDYCASTS